MWLKYKGFVVHDDVDVFILIPDGMSRAYVIGTLKRDIKDREGEDHAFSQWAFEVCQNSRYIPRLKGYTTYFPSYVNADPIETQGVPFYPTKEERCR